MDNTPAEHHVPKTPSLYETHKKVYPQKIAGRFRNLKWKISGAIMAFYFLAPWIRWDRGEGQPDQAILASMNLGRLYFFNIEIWPQEIYYLTGILVLASVGLFLATAMAGRVWCGFTCWQTVWTDLFVWVEENIEGDRNKRMRLDKAPWTFNKIWRKSLKQLIWIAFSLVTGAGFLFFFNDAFETTINLLTGVGTYAEYGFTALFASTTYLLAGFAREQVCIYMCPWPRFQGAMFDEHSLIVTYEAWRGEPRSKAKKNNPNAPVLGDCVDCNLCVSVCPTGIDIREGDQFQCIGCALCVDACNSIMTKLGRPGELITYDSIANQVARSNGKSAKKRVIRKRTIAYASLLFAVIGLMAYGLISRTELEINVQRDRSPMFVQLSNGDIRNGYTFKILNMINVPQTFTLSVEDLEGAQMTVIGLAKDLVDTVTLDVDGDSVTTFRIFVRTTKDALDEQFEDMHFVLINTATGERIDYDSRFAGPVR
ncbi:MAG: cytochrome c oxidase accessory protein CcoG [Magnetovibrio sp.]|nr:cytochrome c oxidase accessory protein CcoG [Magnetovibrio sp.]